MKTEFKIEFTITDAEIESFINQNNLPRNEDGKADKKLKSEVCLLLAKQNLEISILRRDMSLKDFGIRIIDNGQ